MDKVLQNLTSRLRHAQVIHMLDMAGTLSARALRGSQRALRGVARWVAFVIGISLCLPMTVASSGSIDAIEPKPYIRSILNHEQALCLIKLYGKESAFNRLAIGNRYGSIQAYGIPQLKNPSIAYLSAVGQVDAGIDYIHHRYGTPCIAYTHYIKKGWH